jgi:hypothetical protein
MDKNEDLPKCDEMIMDIRNSKYIYIYISSHFEGSSFLPIHPTTVVFYVPVRNRYPYYPQKILMGGYG